MSHFIPRRAKHLNRHEQWQFFILSCITIYEGAVSVLSLGYYSVDTRAWYLFDVMGDD